MLLRIYDHITIADVQERFNDCFPHLKMEFYDEPHGWNQGSPVTHQLSPDLPLGQIRKNHRHGVLEIKSWHKTGQVEEDMRELFGLNIQIFRSYQGSWTQTSYSDELTLGQQEILAQE